MMRLRALPNLQIYLVCSRGASGTRIVLYLQLGGVTTGRVVDMDDLGSSALGAVAECPAEPEPIAIGVVGCATVQLSP